VSRASSTEIAGLAFLSDCQTAALVDGHGSITWMCPPRFDSRSVFGALLDPTAGHWQLGAAGLNETTRAYVKDTLLLETTFQTPSGRAVLTDALLVAAGERGHDLGARSPPRTVGPRTGCARRCEPPNRPATAPAACAQALHRQAPGVGINVGDGAVVAAVGGVGGGHRCPARAARGGSASDGA